LIPVTMMLISPPAWVNSMIRRSVSAMKSMFSVPESMAISAPDEQAYHSTGSLALGRERERGVDPPALGLGEVAQPLRRVGQHRDPGHALGHEVGVGRQQAHDQVCGVPGRWPVHRDERLAVGVEVELLEVTAGERRRLALGRREHVDDLVGVGRAEALRGEHLLGIPRQRPDRVGPRVAEADGRARAADAVDGHDLLDQGGAAVLGRHRRPQVHDDLLQPGTLGQRQVVGRQRGPLARPGSPRPVAR
jgi:hypothetical protein